MSNWLGTAFATLVGVLLGWAMARIAIRFSGRPTKTRDQELNYRVRALETDLRLAQRKAEELAAKLEAESADIAARRQELEAGENKLREREQEIVHLKKIISDECSKTNSLRLELTDRAQETIRAQVRLKEIETELSVTHAGSTAVADEIQRLAAERDELTGRLKAVQQELSVRASGSNVTAFPSRDRIKDH
jgi:chromosome segregation ATPase